MSKPRVRKHKLTRRTLFNWAARQAKANPTYTDNVWEDGGFVTKKLPNSAQRELALLLLGNYNCEICEHKASELRESLSDMAWSGTVGYSTMGVEALLDELFEMLENYGSGGGEDDEVFTYVEDVVAHCNRCW